MNRKGKLLLSLGLMMCMTLPIQAKQEKKKDGEITKDSYKDIVTDLPFSQDISGVMRGTLYSAKPDDNIDIEIPDDPVTPVNPDDPVNPVNPDDPTKPDHKDEDPSGGGGSGGGSGGNQGGGSNHPSNGGNSNGGSSSNGGNHQGSSSNGDDGGYSYRHTPNIPQANQSKYDINEHGESSDGIIYYKWEKTPKQLTIYPALFKKAKEEKKNIVMRMVSEENGKEMFYRVRIAYEDLKDANEETIVLIFGQTCTHKPLIQELLGSAEARSILSCKQKPISIPVYIGVAVPATWDHGYGVYQYEVDEVNQKLILIKDDMQIDTENVVEILMAPGKDYVFSDHTQPLEERNLMTWIKGLTGNSQIVDQGKALSAAALFLAFVSAIASIIILWKRKEVKLVKGEQDYDDNGFNGRMERYKRRFTGR